MHILHLIKTSEGAAWALNLIVELRQQYSNVTFSVVLPSGGKNYKKYFDVCKNVYDLDFGLNGSFLKNGIQLRKIVKQEKPDVIHSWFTQTTLFARLFLRNIKTPRLFQVVGPLHLESRLFKFLDIKSAQKNDFWMPSSCYIQKKYIDSGVNSSRLFLNYAFIDTAKYLANIDVSASAEFKKSLNLPEGIKVIGTASYIYPPRFWQKSGLKNHELLLEIFHKIMKIRQDVVLVVAGETFGNNKKYEGKLKKIARSIDEKRIIFSGKYKDPFPVIGSFDVFVYLSKSENLGGVFESLLFGIPTVSSNRGGLPELVVDGETGFLCSLENKGKIIDSINKVLDNKFERAKFQENGLQKVLDVFNKDQIVANTISAYKQLYCSNGQ